MFRYLMRARCELFAAVVFSSSFVFCQQPKLGEWTELIKKDQCKAAEQLCAPFASSAQIAEQVEAEKCLANVALCGHGALQLQGDDTGGGTLGEGYEGDAVDQALVHLNRGLQLAPQDVTLHQGRLHVLEVATRYNDMIKALDESCSIYKGADAPDVWIAYSAELADLRQLNVGVEFLKVVDKHYPHSPDVLGNIGAFLDMLKRDDEAIPYLLQAVELAPKDPINAWDLARAYDYAEQVPSADLWYKKALALETDSSRLREMHCMYAEFIEKKLKDAPRACVLEKQSCEEEKQTACAASTTASVPSPKSR